MRLIFCQNRKFKRFFRPKKRKKVFTEIETDFSAKIGNSNVFSAQKQVISKKKKITEIETNFSAKIGYSNAFSDRITTSTSQLQHPISFGGGAVFNFSPKSASKAPKTCDFAYFTSQWGGLELHKPPPPPGYATVKNEKRRLRAHNTRDRKNV